ncbi:MAG: hypothetical protein AAB526_02440 [Patescibacteria group bacterium]
MKKNLKFSSIIFAVCCFLFLVITFTPIMARTVKILKDVTQDILNIAGKLVVDGDAEIKGDLKFNNNLSLGFRERGAISSGNLGDVKYISKPSCSLPKKPKIRTYFQHFHGTGNINNDDIIGVWCVTDSTDKNKWKCLAGDCDCCHTTGNGSFLDDGTFDIFPIRSCGFNTARAIYETYCE